MALAAHQLEYHREYRKAHRDAVKVAQRRWYERHGKEYREKNAETVRANGRAYYHRSKGSPQAQAYVRAHKEEKSAYRSSWQREHRGRLNKYNRERWLRTSPRYREVIGIPEGGPAPSCEICGSSKRICMDHCHKTKRFRGWICYKCNLAIGFVDDKIEITERIIEYLKKHQVSRETVNSDS